MPKKRVDIGLITAYGEAVRMGYTGTKDDFAIAMKTVAENPSIQDAVNAWLAEHPEATTTVEDNSVTDAKLYSGGIKAKVNEIYDKAVAISISDENNNGHIVINLGGGNND